MIYNKDLVQGLASAVADSLRMAHAAKHHQSKAVADALTATHIGNATELAEMLAEHCKASNEAEPQPRELYHAAKMAEAALSIGNYADALDWLRGALKQWERMETEVMPGDEKKVEESL